MDNNNIETIDIETRLDIKRSVVKQLQEIDFGAYGSSCMSNSKTLVSKFKTSSLVGEGVFGKVYVVVLNENGRKFSMIVKEAVISENQYELAAQKQYPKEYLINKLVNNAVAEKINPNFVLTYAILFCNSCLMRNADRRCSEMFIEKMDNDLLSFTSYFVEDGTMNTETSDLMMLSCCFQIFCALDVLHRKYGIYHNDIKADNILVKIINPVDTIVQFSKYVVKGSGNLTPDFGYRIPIIGMVPFISDFGESEFLKPMSSIDSDLLKRGSRYQVLNKHKMKKVTTNLSRQDLKNIDAFPPSDFAHDIKNAINMFIGGPRIKKHGIHPFLGNVGLKHTLERYNTSSESPINFLVCQLIYEVFSPIFEDGGDIRNEIGTVYSPYPQPYYHDEENTFESEVYDELKVVYDNDDEEMLEVQEVQEVQDPKMFELKKKYEPKKKTETHSSIKNDKYRIVGWDYGRPNPDISKKHNRYTKIVREPAPIFENDIKKHSGGSGGSGGRRTDNDDFEEKSRAPIIGTITRAPTRAPKIGTMRKGLGY
jgi:serine/threonine protein kinase